MDEGFGIDRAFAQAVVRWRTALNGTAARGAIASYELRGDADALVPALLVVSTPEGSTTLEAGAWPDDLPDTRAALRGDARVWKLFRTEWSMQEIRDYLGMSADADDSAVREAFVASDWWKEFEDMVAHAFFYEWRAALEELRGPAEAELVIAAPEDDDASLAELADRLRRAANTFEATTFDARLLYREASRVAAFLLRTVEE